MLLRIQENTPVCVGDSEKESDMAPSPSDKATTTWWFRFNRWPHTILARLFVLVAHGLLALAPPLPGKARQGVESFARLLRTAAVLMVQPKYIRLWMQPGMYLKVFRDTVILTWPLIFSVFAAWATVSLKAGPRHLTLSAAVAIVATLLGVIVFALVFGTLLELLVISGDIYVGKQDELQRAFSHQAAAFTLNIVMFLLVVLALGYLFVQGWRELAAVHLSLLFFLARMAYLLKLFQLRWKEMAEVEGAADSGPETVSD
jgi:hypothetical protein